MARQDDDDDRVAPTRDPRIREQATRGLESLRVAEAASARDAFTRLSRIAPSDALGPAGLLTCHVRWPPREPAGDERLEIAHRLLALTRDKRASWMYPANLPSGNGWLNHAARCVVRDARVEAWLALAHASLATGALAAAEEAMAHATAIHEEDHAPRLVATRAQILLARGEVDGAYRLAHRVLLHEPATGSLRALAASPEYQAWLVARDLDRVDLASLATRFEPRAFRALVASLADQPASDLPRLPEVTSELVAWQVLAAACTFTRAAPRTAFEPDVSPARRSGLATLAAAAPKSVHGAALICAAFASCAFVCGQDNDDERTYVAALAATPSGHHPVYRYNPRELVFEPGFPSIAALLASLAGVAPSAPPAVTALPADVEPAALSARASWLACGVLGVGRGSIALDTADAPGVDAFDAELPRIAERPHLALYWLLAHAAVDNPTDLRATLDVAPSDPSVDEVRRAVAGGPPRLGGIDTRYLSDLRANAPARMLREPQARIRVAPKAAKAPRTKPPKPPKPSAAGAPVLRELEAWLAARADQPEAATRADFTTTWMNRLMRLSTDDRAIALALVHRVLPPDRS